MSKTPSGAEAITSYGRTNCCASVTGIFEWCRLPQMPTAATIMFRPMLFSPRGQPAGAYHRLCIDTVTRVRDGPHWIPVDAARQGYSPTQYATTCLSQTS